MTTTMMMMMMMIMRQNLCYIKIHVKLYYIENTWGKKNLINFQFPKSRYL